jgi:hypothetical protein
MPSPNMPLDLSKSRRERFASTDRREPPSPGHVCAEARYSLIGFIDNPHFTDLI